MIKNWACLYLQVFIVECQFKAKITNFMHNPLIYTAFKASTAAAGSIVLVLKKT